MQDEDEQLVILLKKIPLHELFFFILQAKMMGTFPSVEGLTYCPSKQIFEIHSQKTKYIYLDNLADDSATKSTDTLECFG